MPMDSPSIISHVEQLRVASDPSRWALLKRLMAAPASLSALGREFGKPASWARYHLKELERVGLVRLAEVRQHKNYAEHLYAATAPAFSVRMLVTPEADSSDALVLLGSDDMAVTLLAGEARLEGTPVWAGAVGSLDGMIAVHQGLADIAGCHLYEPETGEYNTVHARCMFPGEPVVMVTVAEREQGFLVAPGNPRGIGALEDLARPDVRFLNRNPGSGTRVWFDWALHGAGIPPEAVNGYADWVSTHGEAAAAVSSGEADVSVGIRAAAEPAGITFVSLAHERYDLIIPENRIDDARIQRLLNRLTEPTFEAEVRRLGGYSTEQTGRERRVGL